MKRLIISMLTLLLAATPAALYADMPLTELGEASYYANMLHGKKTASGALYDKTALTAAHRKLKFGTKVKVTYLKSGISVIVTINDRGPHIKGRIIDLSAKAAESIGLLKAGHGKVKLEILPN